MTVAQAIAAAERVLPGRAAAAGLTDPRWQAIIAVGDFVESHPEAVWTFVRRWGAYDDEDLRAAIATCVLEHLLEHHAATYRPLAELAAHDDARFADTLRRCWTFGRADAVATAGAATPSSQAFDIVDAEPVDAEAILALQRLAYESEARRYDDWAIPPLVETLASIREHIERHAVLKAVDGDRIVGSVRGVVTDRVCEVGRLIVDPERQRRGIGSALLDAIERRVPDADAYELFTGNRSVENLRLYDRHGYRAVRTEVLSPAVSLVFLRKRALPPEPA